jgi:hypothetical protein
MRYALVLTVAVSLVGAPLATSHDLRSPRRAAKATCTRFAAPSGSDSSSGTKLRPYRTAQELVDSLAPGATGCLRSGTYSSTHGSLVVRFRRGGRPGARITLQSYPGERARLQGIVYVPHGSDNVRLSQLDFEGTGNGSNSVKINAADVVLEDSDLTNNWRGNSCLILGDSSGYGEALRPIVRRNRFHECGSAANGNHDHGIYVNYAIEGQIVDNVFWNLAAYAIHLYPQAQRMRVAHNVIDGDAPSIRGGDSLYASSNNIVEQNVIAYAQTYNIDAWWGGAVGSGNIARNNCLWQGRQGDLDTSAGFTATGNRIADPLFLNRSARDYRLAALSPCLPIVGYDTAALLR